MGEAFVTAEGLKIRYWTNADVTKKSAKPTVVLFHGNAFSIDNWKETGTLESLTKADYPTYAIDLPAGTGSKSDKVDEGRFHDYEGLVPTIESIFGKLGIGFRDVILVGPSLGGGFAVSYSLAHQKRVQGLVLVSPALRVGEKESEELSSLEMPVLLLWGDADTLSPAEDLGKQLKGLIPRARLLIVKGAGHAVYLEKPDEFNEILLDFLGETSG